MILLELYIKVMHFLKTQINMFEWHRMKERGREDGSQQAKPL